MVLRAHSGISIKRSSRNPDYIAEHHRSGSAASAAKSVRIGRRRIANWKLKNPYRLGTLYEPEIGGAADQPSRESRSARFSAARAMVQGKALGSSRQFKLYVSAETAPMQNGVHAKRLPTQRTPAKHHLRRFLIKDR
jgi:hypothetical protein